MSRRVQSKDTFINPATGKISITTVFGKSLAQLLAEKIRAVYPEFRSTAFVRTVQKEVIGKTYTERVVVIAEALKHYLPEKYTDALHVLMQILGPENTKETGMFTYFYWLMPVGKFVELYGLDHFNQSMRAIEEITKRNTGEYAIRPFARRYPDKTLAVCTRWATSSNFHLRRLASEGLRPKLPWAPALSVWNDAPKPVLAILELLKEDEVKFVKKSVANHVRDWLKVCPKAAEKVLARWRLSKNEHTRWIVAHATR